LQALPTNCVGFDKKLQTNLIITYFIVFCTEVELNSVLKIESSEVLKLLIGKICKSYIERKVHRS
jgi:hypothetical protein